MAIKYFISSYANRDQYPDGEIPAYSKFLDSVFIDNELCMKQRAENFSNTYSASPVTTRLKVYKTSSFEHHVKAIDIKIRKYIYENKQHIGVITADRKLIRRLRAVLEHANIQVNDLGGWALATTSAAVVFNIWFSK